MGKGSYFNQHHLGPQWLVCLTRNRWVHVRCEFDPDHTLLVFACARNYYNCSELVRSRNIKY